MIDKEETTDETHLWYFNTLRDRPVYELLSFNIDYIKQFLYALKFMC